MLLSPKSIIRIISFLAAGTLALTALMVKKNIDGKTLQAQIETSRAESVQEVGGNSGLDRAGY